MSGALSAETRDALTRVATATLSAQLHKRGYLTTAIEGVRPLAPGVKLVGRARTLRLIPHRPDLFAERGLGFNPHKRIFDTVEADEVIVIGARSEGRAGTLGDVMAARALYRGAAGVVTDGCVRDAAAVAELGLTVFTASPHPALIGRLHVPWETDVAIACGDAAVVPGDVIVGDDDGVVVIPFALVDEVARDALVQEDEERFIAEIVQTGESLDGLYPMNAAWRQKYETWRDARDAEGPLA